MSVSINRQTMKIVDKMMSEPEYYRIGIEQLPCGATIIDTGLKNEGGLETGLLLTEIAMGGLGKAALSQKDYGGIALPTIFVSTDYPAISLLGSQLAGWGVKAEGFFCMASGPARALALKPKKVFEKIEYRDESDVAVLILETDKKPGDAVAKYVAEKCGVEPSNVFLVLTTTNSTAGSVQVSGRIAEVGMYRLDFLGFDPKKVVFGMGSAPVMPIHPDERVTLAREEDALIYGGSSAYMVDFEDDSKLKEFVDSAPASTSKYYGKTSYETLKAVDFDWSKLDPAFFAPGAICVFNRRTGSSFSAGKTDYDMLKKSLMS